MKLHTMAGRLLGVTLALSAWAQVPTGSPETEWVVDPTAGDDVTGDGTPAKPFRTVSRALRDSMFVEAIEGDLIFLDGDGDGDRDLIRRTEPWTRYFRRDVQPSGGFHYSFLGEIVPPLPNISNSHRFDWDGDGDDDLLISVWGTNPWSLELYLNQGGPGVPSLVSAGPVAAGGVPVMLPNYTPRITSGDVNGDGLSDLVFFRGVRVIPGGCFGIMGVEAVVCINQGTRGSPLFASPVPLLLNGASMAEPACPGAAPLLYDFDHDGDPDLFWCDTSRIHYAECLGPSTYGFSRTIFRLTGTATAEVELVDVYRDGPGGGDRLLLGDRTGYVNVFDDWSRNYSTLELVETVWGVLAAGPREPLTLSPHGPAVLPTVIHLRPGTYDQSNGELFPWLLNRATELRGAGEGRTVVDAGGEEAILLQIYDDHWNPMAPGDERRTIRNLTVRNASRGMRTYYRTKSVIDRVTFENNAVNVQFSHPQAPASSHEYRSLYRHCTIRGGTFGVDVVNNHQALISFQDCLFEGNGTGLRAGYSGAVELERCLFRDHVGPALELWSNRVCSTQPCPVAERFPVDVLGCLFADNGSHVDLFNSPPESNLYLRLWNVTVSGGGAAFRSTSTTVPNAAHVDVRNAILWNGGPMIQGTFSNLSIAHSDVIDPAYAGSNGNVHLAPPFALDGRDGHLVANAGALRDGGDPSVEPRIRRDFDGDPIDARGGVDIGADSILLPGLYGEEWVRLCTRYDVLGIAPGSGAGLLFVGVAGKSNLGGFTWALDPLAPGTVWLPFVTDGRGVTSTNFQVPADPRLEGESVVLQALFTFQSGGTLQVEASRRLGPVEIRS